MGEALAVYRHAGSVTAWVFYVWKTDIPAALAKRNGALYRFLLNKWYFDEVYDFLLVKPAFKLGNFLWKKGDGKVIDGGLNGLAMGIIPWFTKLAGRWQSGYVFTYALAMILGVGGLITWFMITRGLN
jgi:NADH-quinone oxidoreductase subunit L